jgi:very-short-patch-repair endonuclease
MWRDKIISYNPKTKNFARANRRSGNLSEVIVWKLLRDKKLYGLKFSRQRRIGSYIADFYCVERKVVIEIDGASHDYKYESDFVRDEFMRENGIIIIRIDDTDVKRDINKVIYLLENHAALRPSE